MSSTDQTVLTDEHDPDQRPDPSDVHARTALSRLQRWVEAAYSGVAPTGPDVVVTDPEAVESLTDLRLDPSSAVFVPESVRDAAQSAAAACGAAVFGYDGEFDPLGGEIGLEATPVQFETYAAAEYVPLNTPTVLALVEPTDFDILRADVETARETGEFPAFVAHPLVSILDGVAIQTGAHAPGPPRRLLISEPGTVRTSWAGDPVDPTSESYSYVAPAAAECFNQPGSGWCRRYLFVADAMRRLAQRLAGGPDPLVWGFGSGPELDRAQPADDDLAPESVAAPLIVARGDERLVVSPVTGAVSRVPDPVAAIVYADSLGAPPPAAALETMKVDPDHADAFLAELKKRLRL